MSKKEIFVIPVPKGSLRGFRGNDKLGQYASTIVRHYPGFQNLVPGIRSINSDL